jgi:serine/threonine protein kinase
MKCDIWSMGVLMYYMLTGNLPFDGKSHTELFENIALGQFNKTILKDTEKFSGSVLPFLEKMLEVNAGKRASAEELLKHAWL